jgi:hypothetical protein
MKNEDLVNKKFEEVFASFVYPFKTSDQEIAKMSLAKRKQYVKDAMELKKNPVYLQEINETCRGLYFKLAMEEDKEERMMYKGALLFISEFVKRIKQLTLGTTKSKLMDDEIKSFIPEEEE